MKSGKEKKELDALVKEQKKRQALVEKILKKKKSIYSKYDLLMKEISELEKLI